MNKKIPKIFVNNIKKVNNNKIVFYSAKDPYEEIKQEVNHTEIQHKINDLFKSNNFIYKKKFHIKTNTDEKDYIIISKSNDYLLTINGNKIYINDIIEIN